MNCKNRHGIKLCNNMKFLQFYVIINDKVRKCMDKKAFVSKLGFVPKDNTVGIYEKNTNSMIILLKLIFQKNKFVMDI